MSSPRIRRLRSDLRMMQQLRADSTIVDFTVPGMHADAPESYMVSFRGRGLWRDDTAEILIRERHEVFIKLGAGYPRTTPELAWRSPIYHPNISAGGAVCLGGYGTHWTPGLMLDELCTMLWDMIRFDNFDVESPYNREAANWVKVQNDFRFPLDKRPIRDRVAGTAVEDTRPPITHRPVASVEPVAPDVVFLADVVETEIVDAEIIEAEIVEDTGQHRSADGPDILFIE